MPLWSTLVARLQNRRLESVVAVAVMLILRHWYRKSTQLPFGLPNGAARKVRQSGEGYDFDEYDVVVVGGGNAGCVVASRLSEDPSIRVCLLEAGDSSLKNPFATIPASYSRLFRTKHEWDLHTVPQTDADSETRYWPRAKLMGGCTCINALIFHTGAPEDYDEWGRLQGDQEGASQWTFKEMHRYFQKFEKYNPSAEYPNVNAAARGSSGPVQTGLFSYTSPSTSKFIEACGQVGIPHVQDLNTPSGSLGVSRVLTYVTPGGRRVTSEYAYLTPEVLARPNLKVITHAHVTCVLFDQSSPTPRATGVEFTVKGGDTFQVKSRKEVVMCAGAVHTPQILMLSGIGPADHLASHNIPVIADLPGVGSHLLDHPVIDFNILDKTRTSIIKLQGIKLEHRLALIRELIYYNLTGKGMLTSNMAEVIGFVRSTDPTLFPPEEFPDKVEDVTSGPGAPDIEMFLTPAGYLKHGQVKIEPRHYYALHAVLLRPKSQGTIRLKSNDPHEPPIIDPKYLSSKNDLAVLSRAVRLLARLYRTPPLAGMRDAAGDADAALDHAFDAVPPGPALDALVRRKVETLYHPTSTARMAPRAAGGVLDPYLRVHGVPNVRVVDAAAFPNIVSGHTAAPVYALAEKASDMIKAALAQKA